MRGHLSLAALPPVRFELPQDASVHREAEQIFLHLDDRGFVPFHPMLAERFGHKAAIFVGMALYWTRHSLRTYPERSGWFFMSLQQWKSAIGLTRTEQASVREQLLGAGVLEEMLIGRPAVMNYRLNVPALAKALSMPGKADQISWDMASNWFRGCKVYYKPLADVAGTIAAGLYLAYLLQRHRECLKLGQLTDGSIPVSQDEISTVLVLGPKVQRNARDRLKKAGLINEAGIGGALVRINFEAILLCLRGQTIKPLPGKARAEVPAASAAEPHKTEPAAASNPSLDLTGLSFAFTQAPLSLSATRSSSRPRDLLLSFLSDDLEPTQPVEIRQVAQTALSTKAAKPVSQLFNSDKGLAIGEIEEGAAAVPTAAFAVSCNLEPFTFAETCKLDLPFPAIYIQRSSFKTTTTTSSDSDASSASSSRSESSISRNPQNSQLTPGLIFPTWLDQSLHESICKLLKKLPADEQQKALDEMEGASRRYHKVHTPVAWLSGVVKKVAAGDCVWAFAPTIAAERVEREKQAAARKAQEEASLKAFHELPVRTNPASNPSEASKRFDKDAERAKLQALRNSVAANVGKRRK